MVGALAGRFLTAEDEKKGGKNNVGLKTIIPGNVRGTFNGRSAVRGGGHALFRNLIIRVKQNMNLHYITLELTLIEEMLGTAAADPELYARFIESKRPKEQKGPAEIDTLPDIDEEIEKGTTVFHRDSKDRPIIYNYLVKGYLKDAAGMLNRALKKADQMSAYKKAIDGLVFVEPRKIPLVLPKKGEIGICERPLRASTAQGERIALARSETVPAGTKLSVTLKIFPMPGLVDRVLGLLDYGENRGLGQWRNSGKGAFEYEIISEKEKKWSPGRKPRRSSKVKA